MSIKMAGLMKQAGKTCSSFLFYLKEGIIEISNGYFNDSIWRALEILSDIKGCSKDMKLLKPYIFNLQTKLEHKKRTNV